MGTKPGEAVNETRRSYQWDLNQEKLSHIWQMLEPQKGPDDHSPPGTEGGGANIGGSNDVTHKTSWMFPRITGSLGQQIQNRWSFQVLLQGMKS